MDTSKSTRNIGYFIGFIAVNNIIAFSFNLSIAYYIVMYATLILLLIKSKVYIINIYMILLYIACLLSIVGNEIQPLFKSWPRFINFILMTSLVSPFLISSSLVRFRYYAFYSIQYLLQIVVVLSLIFYFAGITYDQSYFTGVTSHSMLLGPISANVFLFSVYNFLKYKEKYFKRIYYIFLMICSFITLLLASSRTAVVGTIIAFLVFIYYYNKEHFFYFIKKIFVIFILLLLSYPMWKQYTDGIINKNEGAEAAGSITSSRDVHWETRIKEFKSSPIIGIGFASVSLGNQGGNFDKKTGQVETGSSWLTLLSMIGLLGFISFFILFINSAKRVVNYFDKRMSAYLLSLLIFWAIHMIAEGYILASGGFLFFSVWLLLGFIYTLDCNYGYK